MVSRDSDFKSSGLAVTAAVHNSVSAHEEIHAGCTVGGATSTAVTFTLPADGSAVTMGTVVRTSKVSDQIESL